MERISPPIRNVTVLAPTTQSGVLQKTCTRLPNPLLTLHVLPVWLTLQRFLTWKREGVRLTSHTLTLTSQAPERPDARATSQSSHSGTHSMEELRKGLGVVTKPASLNHKQKQSDSKWGGKKCLIK